MKIKSLSLLSNCVQYCVLIKHAYNVNPEIVHDQIEMNKVKEKKGN